MKHLTLILVLVLAACGTPDDNQKNSPTQKEFSFSLLTNKTTIPFSSLVEICKDQCENRNNIAIEGVWTIPAYQDKIFETIVSDNRIIELRYPSLSTDFLEANEVPAIVWIGTINEGKALHPGRTFYEITWQYTSCAENMLDPIVYFNPDGLTLSYPNDAIRDKFSLQDFPLLQGKSIKPSCWTTSTKIEHTPITTIE